MRHEYCDICNGSGVEGVEPTLHDIEQDMAKEAAAREWADNAMAAYREEYGRIVHGHCYMPTRFEDGKPIYEYRDFDR